jgi:cobalt-zinc-cadmium efflux system protein
MHSSSCQHHTPDLKKLERTKERKALLYGLILTGSFMFVELIGGLYANSLALIADALHMLTDTGAMALSYFVFWLSQKPTTPKRSFGFHRAEILGALANGLVIWMLCAFLIYEAIERFYSPSFVQGPIVSIIALIGLFVNLGVMKLLHPTQSYSLNIRSAYLHVLGDLLGSAAALIAGILIWWTQLWIIDPIVTCLFSLIILYSSWGMIKEAIHILMESSPKNIDPIEVKKDLEAIESVDALHDLHIWTISSNYPALSVHLVSKEGDHTLNLAHQMLKSKYNIIHTTIQIEHPQKFQSEHCYDCSHHTDESIIPS